MSATQSSDFAFVPKVWQDHIRAFFDRKLVYGSVAAKDETLTGSPGDTVTFPFFTKIGDAEEPAENESLTVDKLTDDSFQCVVKEIGKAVGVKKKAFKKSAATTDRIMSEIQEQIATVHAEKVDKDLLTEFSDPANHDQGFLATAAGDTMNVRTLNSAKVRAFGDRANEALVCFMHSLQYVDMMNDTTTGFLQANALDPMAMVQGFMGRILGMAIVVVDTIPKRAAQIGGKDAYDSFIHKANPYGVCKKQDMEVDRDYDILAREWVVTGDEWYGVKSFHKKSSAVDKRSARISTTVANS